MSGGDYGPGGVPGCGPLTAVSLAKGGFGQQLVSIVESKTGQDLKPALREWVDSIKLELTENTSGLLKRKARALAGKIPDSFPELNVVRSYATPVTSALDRYSSYARTHTWEKSPNVERLVTLMSFLFEWTHPEIHQKFRTLLFPAFVFSSMRRVVMSLDAGVSIPPIVSFEEPVLPPKPQRQTPAPKASATVQTTITSHFVSSRAPKPYKSTVATSQSSFPQPTRLTQTSSGSSSSTLSGGRESTAPSSRTPITILGIHGTRQHASTGRYYEYRVELAPTAWVEKIRGSLTYPDPNVGKARERKEREEALAAERRRREGGSAAVVPVPPPSEPKGPPRKRRYDDVETSIRLWIPALVLESVCPEAVAYFQARTMAKEVRMEEKSGAAARGRRVVRGEKTKAATRPVASQDIAALLKRQPKRYNPEVLHLGTDSEEEADDDSDSGVRHQASGDHRYSPSKSPRRTAAAYLGAPRRSSRPSLRPDEDEPYNSDELPDLASWLSQRERGATTKPAGLRGHAKVGEVIDLTLSD
jgi:Holliday junction resolvase YEN1